MKLSIIIPGIRTYNWETVYNSAIKSISVDFEIIFVGPTEPPDPIKEKVKFIKDFGNPSRCAQLALLHSEGEYILWSSDDCVFVENAVDIGFKMLSNMPDGKNAISFVYTEGCAVYNTNHWFVNTGDCRSRFIPDYYCVVMNALIKKEYMMELGGWDCRFEAWAIGNVDLGIRMQRHGILVALCPDRMLICTHTPCMEGDHGPIHIAQLEKDKPLYNSIYSSSECLNRTVINIENWKDQPNVWPLRFGGSN